MRTKLYSNVYEGTGDRIAVNFTTEGVFDLAGEAFNFILQYSDGSIYQGRVYAQLLCEAVQEVLRDLPEFPGNPLPVRLQVELKLG